MSIKTLLEHVVTENAREFVSTLKSILEQKKIEAVQNFIEETTLQESKVPHSSLSEYHEKLGDKYNNAALTAKGIKKEKLELAANLHHEASSYHSMADAAESDPAWFKKEYGTDAEDACTIAHQKSLIAHSKSPAL